MCVQITSAERQECARWCPSQGPVLDETAQQRSLELETFLQASCLTGGIWGRQWRSKHYCFSSCLGRNDWAAWAQPCKSSFFSDCPKLRPIGQGWKGRWLRALLCGSAPSSPLWFSAVSARLQILNTPTCQSLTSIGGQSLHCCCTAAALLPPPVRFLV